MATLTLPNGTVLTVATRQSCLDRITAIPLGVIPYSNNVISPVTNRRADCTGLVSYVWATPLTGSGIWLHAYNTFSFYTTEAIRRINWTDLLPGDTIGSYGPSNPLPRHGAIWLGGDKRPDGRFHIFDHGSGLGPKDRWVQWDGVSTGWLHPDHLAPWRYVAITEGEDEFMGALSDDDQTAMKWRIEAIPSLRDPINLHVKDSAGKDRLEPNLLAQDLVGMSNAIAELQAGGATGLTEDQVRAIVREELDKTEGKTKLGLAP